MTPEEVLETKWFVLMKLIHCGPKKYESEWVRRLMLLTNPHCFYNMRTIKTVCKMV
jgi:hypothetical protein